METYCTVCRKNTKKLTPKNFKTKNARLIMLSKCAECRFKKTRFVKEQEEKGLLSNLGIKTSLSKIPLLNILRCIKMNETVNKFLLAGDKFMSEMHLKQPGFAYSACGPFTRHKERIEKFMHQEIQILFTETNVIKLDKACFHDMAYGKSKDLTKRTQSDKILRDKAFKIASDPKYDGYQRGLASIVYKSFDKKSSGGGVDAEPNYQLESKLHRQIIRKFKRQKVYSSFRDNIWGVDLADMQSLSKYNKGIIYLLCATNSLNKYAWVVLLKDKRGTSIVNAFQKIISKGRKPDKMWVDQGCKFYNNLFKRFLKINNTEMYSTHNGGKSAERFIRTLKNKIFKHMRGVSKNVYFEVLDDIVNKYNNTVHRSIKMKPTDIKSDSYPGYNEDSNATKLNSKLVIMLRFQNTKKLLLKDTRKIGQEKFLLLGKLKIQFRGYTQLVTRMVKKLLEVFMRRNCKKLVKKNSE